MFSKRFNSNKQFVSSSLFFTNNNKILLIRNRSNYISFSPQIAYKLIKAGRSRDILQKNSNIPTPGTAR